MSDALQVPQASSVYAHPPPQNIEEVGSRGQEERRQEEKEVSIYLEPMWLAFTGGCVFATLFWAGLLVIGYRANKRKQFQREAAFAKVKAEEEARYQAHKLAEQVKK